ncbi:hypothetical protein [Phenylobacterium sp.]|uniref:hypothetical protein n=1 Tax=Phenylobacterium sp. TaxID=1871053 RepID=UPI00272F1AC9|nr:hypothetical protein [Phenylobacterium sp.]MDP1616468.1 hypothetical protein [Phenylobacterium sp.]MDP1988015.1 hypothetical protein [Phenylobacterium sp.]
MAEHPKPPASSTERTSDTPGQTRPGAQAFGIGAEESRPESSGIVDEHKAYVKKIGHPTAPETDLGEPAEEMPDPTENP